MTAPTECPDHAYTEQSARDKLARHRQRGDFDQRMIRCPWFDHWHVVDEKFGPCECCGDRGESARDPAWGNELLCLHCQPCFGCGEMGGDCDLHECRKGHLS